MEKYEEREVVQFSNEGNKIFGIIHRPVGKSNAPIVMFCHGLAGHHIGKNRIYVQLSESLSRIGIASFRFDFRGSGDSEGDFSEMSLEGEVSDAEKALAFLKEQPNLDFDRLGIYGRSFGGAIAVHAAAREQRVKSMALWAPVFSGEQWKQQWELVLSNQLDEEGRNKLMSINGQMPSLNFYQELFSMDLTKEYNELSDVPLLLIHGKQDLTVGMQHSEKIMGIRSRFHRETSFISLPHSDHDFNHSEERDLAIRLTCEWFAKSL